MISFLPPAPDDDTGSKVQGLCLTLCKPSLRKVVMRTPDGPGITFTAGCKIKVVHACRDHWLWYVSAFPHTSMSLPYTLQALHAAPSDFITLGNFINIKFYLCREHHGRKNRKPVFATQFVAWQSSDGFPYDREPPTILASTFPTAIFMRRKAI